VARILTVDPERTRGLRKLLYWTNKRQYGGVVPGIFKILAQDLNLAALSASARDARHCGQRACRGCSLTGPAYGGRASPN
jgi:hypothetical protein